ncbi:MAG TPA: hypothetical protein VLC92_09655 [Rhodocyclaceae bacterium]|nr:hypothetical protein [Rhodocyclaceae bacterium]
MFQIGKKYDIEMIEEGDELGSTIVQIYPDRTITKVEGSRIQIDDNGKTVVINTESRNFVRATLRE